MKPLFSIGLGIVAAVLILMAAAIQAPQRAGSFLAADITREPLTHRERQYTTTPRQTEFAD